MKKIILFAFTILTINYLQAQIGISGAYKTFNAEDWFALETSQNIDPYGGYNVGLDYWFRLKNQRLEFMPEISYGKYSGDFETGELSAQFWNFQLNTNIYFLDFNNDCNCPTFDKDGNIFTKGFFIQLSPGVSRINFENTPSDPELSVSETVNAFSFGIGAGLDIGISKLMTISPIVRYRFFPEVEAAVFGSETPVKTTVKQLYLGLHLGIRWNDGSGSKGGRRSPFGRR